MPQGGAFPRRPATEWGIRLLVAAVVAATGYVGATRTLAYTMRGSDLELAHAMAPADGRIAALLSQQLSDAHATPADRQRADRLAREALLHDPTAVAAAATLALDAQVRGDATGARRLFGYAQSLSRRDLRTQIWTIEDAVGRGDVPGALRHYDIALRTGRGASDLLFPVLSSAIAEPPIRAALIDLLARGPGWGPHFINYAAGQGADLRATVSLLYGLRRAGVPVPDGTRTMLIDRLVAGDLMDEAWSVHAAAYPGADRRMSRDPDFKGDAATASRLDWLPINDGGISTSIQRGSGNGIFDFSAPSGVGGLLLRQLQMLPPGRYRLDGRSVGIEQPDDARPYWVLSCSDGRELGRADVPDSAQANGAFAGRFDVPAECPVQTLSLFARPSDAIGGLSGEIHRAWLHPAG